jgi:undecaprenyl diphosphate synthase
MTPKHIAIIMDGNRRWAREHNVPVLEGHRRVAGSVLEKLIAHASSKGVQYLTLWAWSTENWKREKGEVRGIMNILRLGFVQYGEKMHKNGIRIRVIGNITKLDNDIQKSIRQLVDLTKDNTRITVIFALNYGGRDEILRAIQKIPHDQNNNITIEQFNNYLDTAGIPDPELIIRTGGEERLSGFLLWQSEYSELYFPSWYMPDFTPERLDEAIEEYVSRQRRFGK